MTPMSSLSRHSKERRAADNNSTSLPTHGVRKFRKGSSILTVIKFIAKDGTSLAAAILSAIILQGYNPHRKHISRISKILGNQRLKHLKTQQSSGHFVHLESASQWIKQARTQLMEKIGRHETLDITVGNPKRPRRNHTYNFSIATIFTPSRKLANTTTSHRPTSDLILLGMSLVRLCNSSIPALAQSRLLPRPHPSHWDRGRAHSSIADGEFSDGIEGLYSVVNDFSFGV